MRYKNIAKNIPVCKCIDDGIKSSRGAHFNQTN